MGITVAGVTGVVVGVAFKKSGLFFEELEEELRLALNFEEE